MRPDLATERSPILGHAEKPADIAPPRGAYSRHTHPGRTRRALATAAAAPPRTLEAADVAPRSAKKLFEEGRLPSPAKNSPQATARGRIRCGILNGRILTRLGIGRYAPRPKLDKSIRPCPVANKCSRHSQCSYQCAARALLGGAGRLSEKKDGGNCCERSASLQCKNLQCLSRSPWQPLDCEERHDRRLCNHE